jgi:D-beta-D-heptose 7-phosphate kinase/D-beta-D-heptose 1-phosphate adenosyltransferase
MRGMDHDLIEIVEHLGSPRVLLVGDFILDKYTFGACTRVSPEAPVPILRIEREETRLGGAGGVAADLVALGAKVACCGLLGEDAAGRTVLAELAAIGADASGLCVEPGRPTTTKQRMVGLAQGRHPHQMMRIDAETTAPPTDATAERMLAFIRSRAPDCDAVVIEDYAKGALAEPICSATIAAARSAGVPVVIDPALQDGYAQYAGANCITPNRTEAEDLAGCRIADAAGAAKAAAAIRDGLGLEAVVVTLDKEGAYLLTAAGGAAIPTRARHVYDTTGAGDMVISAIAVALGAKVAYPDAVRLANVAAGIEVEKFGAQTVPRAELLARLYAEHHSTLGKLLERGQLLRELQRLQALGRRIVFTNGCFDVFHLGHIKYLQFARDQGDVLVVGLNSDASVRELKGAGRPICGEQERAGLLAGLSCVDFITIFPETSVLPLVKEVRPDVLVKGGDYDVAGVVGHEVVAAYGGRVVLAPKIEGLSSSSLVERIVEKYRQQTP